MNELNPEMLAEWKLAIGRTEARHEVLEFESLRRYAVAVGSDAKIETVLPPLAHWAFFLPHPSDVEIGPDGHPRRGGFLPAISLPRRMFASADIAFTSPLVIGVAAEMISTIADVTHKRGRSGDLMFVEVDRTIRQGGEVCVRERQSYVYRAMGGPPPMPAPASTPPEGEVWCPDTVNLFRFSAATFNGHRIHYDLDYAQGEEG